MKGVFATAGNQRGTLFLKGAKFFEKDGHESIVS
jgi:hypothetical protein